LTMCGMPILSQKSRALVLASERCITVRRACLGGARFWADEPVPPPFVSRWMGHPSRVTALL
jgi:hypothetical protein